MEHSQEKNKKVSTTTLPLFRSSSSLFQCPHDCFVEENTDGEDMRSLAVIVQQQIGDKIDTLDRSDMDTVLTKILNTTISERARK